MHRVMPADHPAQAAGRVRIIGEPVSVHEAQFQLRKGGGKVQAYLSLNRSRLQRDRPVRSADLSGAAGISPVTALECAKAGLTSHMDT
jgi:hypothetical protein